MKRTLTAILLICLFVASPFVHAGSWEKPVAKVRQSIGQLTLWENGEIEGYCTAFSINDQKDYFLTAYHCNSEYISMDGMNAYPIWSNPDADLLLLVVPDSDEGRYPSLHLASDVVKQGQPVGGLGFGYAWPGRVSTFMAGYVVAPDVMLEIEGMGKNEHYTSTNIVIPGMSGGPMFDENGNVVSMVQMGDARVGIGRTLAELKELTGKFWSKE